MSNSNGREKETERNIEFNRGNYAFLRENGQKTSKTYPPNHGGRFFPIVYPDRLTIVYGARHVPMFGDADYKGASYHA